MPGVGNALANDYVTLWRATDPSRQIGYCPSLAVLPTGRLLGTLLVKDSRPEAKEEWLVRGCTSDDSGATWVHRTDIPMVDGFPFVAGSSVYIIGGRDDLKIARSADWGETWSRAAPLKTDRLWYSFPGSIVRVNGRIYMVKECRTEPIREGFPVWVLAPVVMSASLTDDLTRPDAWTYSSVLSFGDVLERHGQPNLMGVPFYEPGRHDGSGPSRSMTKLGWGEANLVQITDPDHIWHDPTGSTFHMFLRCTTGRSNLAAMAKAVEQADGSIVVDLQRAPSGEPVLYVPFPGGHIGFVVVPDPQTGLHWLLASQATDSMRRVDRLHPKHYGMPANERRQIALHFSRNCMDWCFAGLVVAGDEVTRSCYHAGAAIDGDDLVMLMRTADANAANAHDSNLITFHRVPRFRELAY